MIDCDTALLYLAADDDHHLTQQEDEELRAHVGDCELCSAINGAPEGHSGSSTGDITADDFATNTTGDPAAVTVTDEARSTVAFAPNDDSHLPTVDPETYEWGKCIGRGGMGKITRVRDRRLARHVAIKESVGQHRRIRFEREALITARLQHPAIVPVYEAGTWPNGTPFYSMKMVVGTSFEQVLDRAEHLNDRIALLPKLIVVAEAIAYAHSQRIIHRDLKPANILVGEFGETVVIDWGLAKELATDDEQAPEVSPYRNDAGLTVVGQAFGTPRYMPPEQARGDQVDERADVYALGAILYQVLAGQAPYEDAHTGPREVLSLVRSEPPTPIARLQPEAPADLIAIVEKAMARDLETRYANAGELAADLERFQTGQLVSAREYSGRALASRWLRRHRMRIAIAAGLMVVASIAGTVAIAEIVSERNRAQRSAAEADRQFQLASSSSAETQRLLTQAHVDQGRRELLAGRPAHAAAYLAQAAVPSPRDPRPADALDLMRRQAARTFDSREAVLQTKAPIVGGFFDAQGRAIVAVQRGDNLALINASTQRVEKTLRNVGRVDRLVASADGTRVACLGSGSSSLWAMTASEPLATLGRNASAPRRVWFSPRGTLLAVAERDGTVSLRSPDGVPTHRLAGHTSGSIYLSFHHEGQTIALLDRDHVAWIYDTRGTLLRRYQDTVKSRRRPTRIVIGPAQKYILLGNDDFASFVELSRLDISLHIHPDSEITSLAVSSDGRVAALGHADGSLGLWDMVKRYQVWGTQMSGHGGAVTSLAFTRDGTSIVSGGADWSARLWDRRTGALAATMADQPGGGDWHARVDASGKRVLVVSGAKTAIVWRTESTRLLASLPRKAQRKTAALYERPGIEAVLRRPAIASIRKAARKAGALNHTDISPGHDYMLTATTNATDVALWRIHGGERIATLVGHEGKLVDSSYRSDGAQVATVDSAGTVRVFATATGTPGRSFATPGTVVTSIAIGPTGGRIVTGDMAGTAHLWNAKTGTVVASLPNHSGTAKVAGRGFSPDGQLVATTATDGRVHLWRADSGRAFATLNAHDSRVTQAFFHRDDLLVTTARNALKIWKRSNASFELLSTIEQRKQPIGDIAVNNDASLVATFDQKVVTVWDTAQSAEVATLTGTAAAFSHDGHVLATASRNGLLLWRWHSQTSRSWAATARSLQRSPYTLRDGRLHIKRQATATPVFIVPGKALVRPAGKRR